MDYIGLFSKFKVNRPLTEEERTLQLKQDKRLDVEPLNQLSTIRMNSTYLEVVDKFYGWKGFASVIAVIFIAILLWFTIHDSIAVAQRAIRVNPDDRTMFLVGEFIWLTILMIFLLVFMWAYRKESFAYTHYPIRLNRKNGKIYVFRLNGTVLSMPWNDVFITLGQGQTHDIYDIRGHVLDTDGETVKESFAFSHYSGKNDPDLMQFWEFIRRYMADGPATLIQKVEHVMEISHKKETFWNGFHRLIAEMAPVPLVAVLTSPLWFVIAIFRWIAMRTSKIPQWPQWVEDECAIEPDDLWIRDGRHRA
ncbi:MAG TPA: DUF6708 domain-containing protein [Thiobacillus sp.]